MTAPERIWVGDERPVGGTIHVWNELAENARRYATEYIRADLVPDPAAIVRAAPEAAADACADYPRSSPEYSEYIHYDDQIVHSQNCIRALAADPAAVAAIVAKAKGAGE